MARPLAIRTVLLIACMSLFACSGKRPSDIGVSPSGLAPCPSSPNCISSDARDEAHVTAPFLLDAPPAEAWQVAREVVTQLPRTRIMDESPDYLHAECRSAVFGFVDDLELHIRPSDGFIAVRSASRLGYSDLGVNRRRVEALRSSLIRRGVVRQHIDAGGNVLP